jgi:hypothetical protein
MPKLAGTMLALGIDWQAKLFFGLSKKCWNYTYCVSIAASVPYSN